jgi:hypothetical protein
MADFTVHGPYNVPFKQNRGGRAISSKDGKAFWEEHPELTSSRGCYVFGVRSGGGMKPGYVGKATKGFGQETFESHKLVKYITCLSLYKKGTPVLFFIVAPAVQGKPNLKQIGELEDFLIQEGLAVNPNLQNERGTKTVKWTVVGVVRSRKGRPTQDAVKFRKMMAL